MTNFVALMIIIFPLYIYIYIYREIGGRPVKKYSKEQISSSDLIVLLNCNIYICSTYVLKIWASLLCHVLQSFPSNN